MAQTFIFRPDPAPWQPTSHVPIPAQGQQPPRGPTQLAVCMQIIRAAWEPPPPAPRQLPLTIAPLTLTYGQQPSPGPTQANVNAGIIRRAWEPPDPAPRQPPPSAAWNIQPAVLPYMPLPAQILAAWQPPPPAPYQRPPTVPIPAQGDQPPSDQQAATVHAGIIRQAWEPPLPAPWQQLPSLAWNVAPATVPYAPLPPTILSAWQPSWYPAQTAAPVAPLTLPTGQQPPPYSVTIPAAIRRAWEPPDPQPWQKPPTQIVSVDRPPPYAPLPANVLAAWRAPDPWPWQRLPTVPIPAQGDQPPRTQLPNAILSSWQPAWYPAQSAAPNASWNFVIIVTAPPPYAPLPQQVLSAWVAPWYPAQSAAPVAPLTLVYGQQPPEAQLPNAILAAWQPTWYPAQSAPPSAAWNIAITAAPPSTPLLASILATWQPQWYPAQKAPPFVPVKGGDQPSAPRPGPDTAILSWPQPAWAAQTAPVSAAWNVLAVQFVARTFLPQQILTAWVIPWYPAQTAAPVAPLTLRYGQQPPRLPTLFIQTIARAWQPPDPQPLQQAPAQLLTGPSPPPPPPPPPPSGPPPFVPPPSPALLLADVADDDTERAVLLLWRAAGDMTPVEVVDADTEAAIVRLWKTAGDIQPVELVDNDTERAVLSLWRSAMQLPSLFKRDPQTGRLKSLDPGADVQTSGPYAVLDCQLDSRKLAYADQKATAFWNDYRKVTITIYGTRADVVQAAGAVMAIFNRKLGAQGQRTLTYPSGARFIRWEPTNQVHIEEDRDTKAGRDVWRAVIEAKVWSIRST